MVTMDSDRLERWKCLYCGCHEKHVGVLKDTSNNNEPYATVVVCHNCGRVDYFVKSIRHAMRMLELDNQSLIALHPYNDRNTKAYEILNIDLSKYQ